LKGDHNNLNYIDGFAGMGTYTYGTDRVDGSPLRALNKVASLKDLAERVSFLFVEQDAVLAAELEEVVGQFHAANPSLKKPLVHQGAFADGLKACLDDIEKRSALKPAEQRNASPLPIVS